MQEEQFTQDVIAILHRHHPEWQISRHESRAAVFIGSVLVSLDNLFLIARDLPEEDREKATLHFFEHTIKTEAEPGSENIPYPEAKARLLVQIIPAEYEDVAPQLVHRPLFSGLSIAYVFNEEGRYEILQQPTLAAWNVTPEEVEAQAIANLEALTESQELKVKYGETGAFVTIASDDSFSAARLVLPGFMARVREALDAAEIYVGIPDRDFMVAWTLDFSGRQNFAAKLKLDFRSEPYPLTDDIFVSSDAGMRPASEGEMQDHGR